jgi:hypothetical protein
MLTSDLSCMWEFVSEDHFMQNSPRVIAFVCNNQNFRFFCRDIISLIVNSNEEYLSNLEIKVYSCN